MPLGLRWALHRGLRLLREGDRDAALAYFLNLSGKYPASAAVHFELGKLFYKRENLEQARRHLRLATEHRPTPDIIQGILEMTNWWMVSSPLFFNGSPAFSPDGKKLLYTSARWDTNNDGKIDSHDHAAIYLFDLETGVEKELVTPRYANSNPVWAPDGQSFFYLSMRRTSADSENGPGGPSLYWQSLEPKTESLVIPGTLHPRYPAISPDGKFLIACTVDMANGPSGLSIIHWPSQKRESLTSHAWEHTFPQMDARGERVCFISWRRDTEGQGRITLEHKPGIYLLNLHARHEQQVVSDTYANAYPRFSPDGQSILFLSRRRDTNGDGKIDSLDNFGVYVLNLKMRQERCVSSDDHYNKFPAWSADGKSVLFLAHWPHREERPKGTSEDYFEFKGIYSVPASGGAPRCIVSDKFFGSRFCEPSPKGPLVAYVSWRPKTNRGLYVADTQRLPTPDQLRGFIQNNLAE